MPRIQIDLSEENAAKLRDLATIHGHRLKPFIEYLIRMQLQAADERATRPAHTEQQEPEQVTNERRPEQEEPEQVHHGTEGPDGMNVHIYIRDSGTYHIHLHGQP